MTPEILCTTLDPHHETHAAEWGWDGDSLYHRPVPGTGKWVKVKRINFTPERLRTLANLVEAS